MICTDFFSNRTETRLRRFTSDKPYQTTQNNPETFAFRKNIYENKIFCLICVSDFITQDYNCSFKSCKLKGQIRSFEHFCRSSRGKVRCLCKQRGLHLDSRCPMRLHRFERNGFQRQRQWDKLKVNHRRPVKEERESIKVNNRFNADLNLKLHEFCYSLDKYQDFLDPRRKQKSCAR